MLVCTLCARFVKFQELSFKDNNYHVCQPEVCEELLSQNSVKFGIIQKTKTTYQGIKYPQQHSHNTRRCRLGLGGPHTTSRVAASASIFLHTKPRRKVRDLVFPHTTPTVA